MIEPDLPVFTFRPNWRDVMPERLSFLTDVLRSDSGAEQRRSVRETPRRTFEVDFLLVGGERTFWDLFINRLAGGEVYAPLYWEAIGLKTKTTAGVTTSVAFDTRWTEWPYMSAGYALLMGQTAFDWEVVLIQSVNDSGVTFTEPVERAWPVGTKLVPLRRSVLDQVGDPSHDTAAVATVSTQFRVTGPNPWTVPTDTSDTYLTLPVFNDPPNWVEALDVTYARDIAALDTGVGLTYQVDPLGRAFVSQAHRWFLNGRQKLAAFRSMLYRHRGRAGSFWLPTFKSDFKLAAPATSGSPTLTVENTGFRYTGGPTSGREYVAVKAPTGMIYRKIVNVLAGLTPETERIVLDSPLGVDLSVGLAPRISFMDTARFDTDDFEITHHAGIDSLHEVSATFRTFKNTRTAPTPISYPIPISLKDGTPCGTGVRAGAWRYLPIAVGDTTLRSAKNFDDSSWAVGVGPFGNNPGGGSGARPAPNTYLAPNTACWFRCRVPRGVPGMTIAQDDVSDVWFNGTKLGPQYGIGEATVLFPDTGSDDNVCAVRVIDSVGTYIYFWDSMAHTVNP